MGVGPETEAEVAIFYDGEHLGRHRSSGLRSGLRWAPDHDTVRPSPKRQQFYSELWERTHELPNNIDIQLASYAAILSLQECTLDWMTERFFQTGRRLKE